MAVTTLPRSDTRLISRRTPSGLHVVDEGVALNMSTEPNPNIPKSTSMPAIEADSELFKQPLPGDSTHGGSALQGDYLTSRNADKSSYLASSPPTPGLSRATSYSGSSSAYQDEEVEQALNLERISVFDILENLALPQRLEKLQNSLSAQAEKVRRQQKRLLQSTGLNAKDGLVDEWRRRLPPPDEQLEKYKKRMRASVDRLSNQWNDSKAVTAREKASFIAGVLNIFISGYLIGSHPEWFHMWYTGQLLYFMPIRYYTYQKKGYHYFLADLCYFVNLLTILSIWFFPQSKRLFISTYCLAYGNNAIAIAMWRNSLVFHSLDKITSLFIHIMPCVTLHCLIHILSPELQATKFPAIHTIIHSSPNSPDHYSLRSMIVWATVPYLVWQLSYHMLITVRRREKIAAGRPTSFTWLRKSYAPTLIGKAVLALPDYAQEPAFMAIQYGYAVATMLPCPLWFWYRWLSAGFLLSVFGWSVYNGATYYIDIFGTRFQKELEMLKKDVAKWQGSPEFERRESEVEKADREVREEEIPSIEGAVGGRTDGIRLRK
ncbi:hypothetical protein M501DRAFT_995293 [Patellaria atrata CBS 101060]|uniref:Glycerophosphocholine acyltransferase 1 n=1 Tax=Patellaria atrata CBS 101060 TaxID=1346257 RepID=A0A9P4VRZ0_9PEZI|nr:hypothetical protein M501DRAFT_995293 [Patellaria atrata CBS 101060]